MLWETVSQTKYCYSPETKHLRIPTKFLDWLRCWRTTACPELTVCTILLLAFQIFHVHLASTQVAYKANQWVECSVFLNLRTSLFPSRQEFSLMKQQFYLFKQIDCSGAVLCDFSLTGVNKLQFKHAVQPVTATQVLVRPACLSIPLGQWRIMYRSIRNLTWVALDVSSLPRKAA